MRSDEFRQALSLLPAALHDRVPALRRHLFRDDCPRCQRVGDTVTLALTAAHYGQVDSAGRLLDNATRLAAEHDAAGHPPDRERGHGRAERRVAVSASVTAGTDAGRDGHPAGNGRFVLRPETRIGPTRPRARPAGPVPVSLRRTGSGLYVSSPRLLRAPTG
ncbi:hypothetical protein [Micromonospora sp. NPDC049240]|uniref:hypothetical protein n=1 Tax=Micromonospora sp. NPDC049240 TaxID=3155151 RepID=UPI0033FA7A79